MSLKIAVSGAAAAAAAEFVPVLVADKVASRVAAKDFTLWGKDAEAESSIRLGWVGSAFDSAPLVEPILALRAEFAAKGVNRFVLCGMGGSSLAPEVITRTAGVELVVLDSTDPDQINEALSGDLARTAVVVSSKSGSTVETDSQKRTFEKAFADAGLPVADRIVVVTDPGSPMEAAAKADGYRVFNADPTVGGRYSALTAFGLVPSGLAGADIAGLLDEAQRTAELLASDTAENPGLILGAAMARTALAAGNGYRDKVGIITDGTAIVGFGDWAEQLIAESTGKIGKGVLPVVLEPNSHEVSNKPTDMLQVRVVADATAAHGDEVSVSGPLGAQFLLWEYATVVASRLLELNPFDQPDVESAKVAARAMLSEGTGTASAPLFVDNGIEVRAHNLDLSGVDTVKGAIAALFGQLAADGYVSVQAYLDRTSIPGAYGLREAVASATDRPTTFGWGPRFLHSTGQYHKGGPRQGVFLQLVAKGEADLAVPGREFTFGELIASQAAGDASVLGALPRPVLTLTLTDVANDVAAVFAALS
ncbi:MAG: glucose-6-phosphate isomerase [Micrococcales bacterium]